MAQLQTARVIVLINNSGRQGDFETPELQVLNPMFTLPSHTARSGHERSGSCDKDRLTPASRPAWV